MNMKQHALLASVVALSVLLGCDKDDPESTNMTFKVAGTVPVATIQYETEAGIHVLADEPLPFVHDYIGNYGDGFHVYTSSPDASATLYIQILENDVQVLTAPGCFCNGNYVSAELSGTVGDW